MEFERSSVYRLLVLVCNLQCNCNTIRDMESPSGVYGAPIKLVIFAILADTRGIKYTSVLYCFLERSYWNNRMQVYLLVNLLPCYHRIDLMVWYTRCRYPTQKIYSNPIETSKCSFSQSKTRILRRIQKNARSVYVKQAVLWLTFWF